MYSDQELELIFNNCFNFEEIIRALTALLFLKGDGDITILQENFIREKSQQRVREI
ncbi:hypothetical protein ACNQGP_00660 [Flavobacterium sp. GT2N3]|uniref:hypothetical protein n=1 Tax=unclassified Flavobacterium TaxID=196869 RepID=UPI003AAC13D7